MTHWNMKGRSSGQASSGKRAEASSETASQSFLEMDLTCSVWREERRADLSEERVESARRGQRSVSWRRRRMADMVRDSGRGEDWRRRASWRERESGWFCLQRLKRDSAWARCSLVEDMRGEIRVSKWEGSGPRRRASWCGVGSAAIG